MLNRRRNPKAIPTKESATSGNLRICLQNMRVKNPQDVLFDIQIQKGERVGHTCEWIQKREEFSTWGATDNPEFLRLIGSPGIGKTMMSTFLVGLLKEKVEKAPGKAFAYFFCDDKNQDRKTSTAILRSLIWQLLLQKNELFQHIQSDFEKHERSRLFEDLFENFSALWRIFRGMLQDENAGEVFILIDALDECERSTRKGFLRGMRELFHASPTSRKFRFLVTCRPKVEDIERELGDVGASLMMDSSDVNDDLSKYIDSKVDELSRQKEYPPDLKGKVAQALKRQAGGTFLWVSLMVADLAGGDDWEGPLMHEVEDRLNCLPRGLEDTYAVILGRIDERRREVIRFVLHCMVAARRPLTKVEIETAFATWKSGSMLPRPDLQAFKDICSACGSILYVGHASHEDTTTLNFCHQSVKDFLLRDRSDADSAWYHTTRGSANLLMFEVCWQYLSSEAFDYGSLVIRRENNILVRETKKLQSRFQEHSFLEYSSNQWEDHAMGSYPAWERLKIDIAKGPTLRDAWLLRAARYGQTQVLERLLKNGGDLNTMDFDGWTPLLWAVMGGHKAIVQLLFEKGVDINSKDNDGRTPLLWATGSGQEAIVQLLLEKGANINSKDNDSGGTPLSSAVVAGHKAVVQLLLEKGADINSKDNDGQTPLSRAILCGQEAIAQLLLEKGADINSKDNGVRTPLFT